VRGNEPRRARSRRAWLCRLDRCAAGGSPIRMRPASRPQSASDSVDADDHGGEGGILAQSISQLLKRQALTTNTLGRQDLRTSPVVIGYHPTPSGVISFSKLLSTDLPQAPTDASLPDEDSNWTGSCGCGWSRRHARPQPRPKRLTYRRLRSIWRRLRITSRPACERGSDWASEQAAANPNFHPLPGRGPISRQKTAWLR